MKELKVTKAKAIGAWIFDRTKYYRPMEAGVLCNFEGHGGVEKIGDLVKALQRLPQDAIFTLDEDEGSGRMGIFANWNEERKATPAEIKAEETLYHGRLKAARTLIDDRKVADALLRKAKHRQELEGQLLAVRAAKEGVLNELKNPHPSEEDDLHADLETLETEETRLATELANL